MSAIRVRFAPSPTGELHIGSLRSSLYNFLFARKNKGTFILRIEDTDRERLVPGATERILALHQEFNMVPDEGVLPGDTPGTITQKGDCGPYIQSERLSIYTEHARQLASSGHAYYCFCTQERLEKLRETQTIAKTKIGYDRHCRSLPAEEARTRIANGEKAVLRMRIPEEGTVRFTDMIRGEIVFTTAELDDYVLIKSDAFPTYHFANVVDDHLMRISHVIRGEEWISSTPKHVVLYQAFGWELPQFAHIPLLLNPDKSKLSKRQGDVAALDYLKKGYLPEALINFIALLGWNPRGDQEIYSIDALIEQFDITKVNTAGAVFNHEKLDWLNRHYIKQMSDEHFVQRIKPYLEQKGLHAPDHDFLLRIAPLEKERITTMSEVGEETGFLFHAISVEPGQLVWKQSTPEQTKEILGQLVVLLRDIAQDEWGCTQLEGRIKLWVQEHGKGNGEVLWPLRIALSGREKSPDPFSLAFVHGKEKTLALVEKAYASL